MMMKTGQNVRGLVYSGACRGQRSSDGAGDTENDRGLKVYLNDRVIVEIVCGWSLHADLMDRSARMSALMLAANLNYRLLRNDGIGLCWKVSLWTWLSTSETSRLHVFRVQAYVSLHQQLRTRSFRGC